MKLNDKDPEEIKFLVSKLIRDQRENKNWTILKYLKKS